jgi:hypothetical protein
MDRVWQLETETFRDVPGFVFAPITQVIQPDADATALHPEVQRQVANIRTDMDRFSPLEISSLVRHGYCVGRQACREHPGLFGADLPAGEPWDPVPAPRNGRFVALMTARGNGSPRQQAAATAEARTLQGSSLRRIWSTLLDYRDWVSYIYVPLIIPFLILVPACVFKLYQRSHHLNQLVDSLSQGTRELALMSYRLENDSVPWASEASEKVHKVAEPDLKGFEVVQEARVLDLRSWAPSRVMAAFTHHSRIV